MRKLKEMIMKGWPEGRNSIPVVINPYHQYRNELAVHHGLSYRGERVVIPAALRPTIMKEEIHSLDLGIQACLRRNRECIIWIQ